MSESIPYDLPHGSKKHDDIRRALYERYQTSKRAMSESHARWRKAEEQHQLYIKPSDADALRKSKRKSEGEVSFVKLVVPYSYAMVMTAHTYYSTVFLARNPVFQFAGRHGEAESSTQAVESLVAYQTDVGGHLVPMYVWLLDALKYGAGILGTYWDTETIVSSSYEEVEEVVAGIVIEGSKKRIKKVRKSVGYDGSRYYNVRPWDFFPDPRVPLSQCHKGEFCGRVTEVGWNTLLRGKQAGRYFNLEAAKVRRGKGGSDKDVGFEAGEGIQLPQSDSGLDKSVHEMGYFKLLEVCVDLVPKEWGLGDTDTPEKWVFTLVDPDQGGGVVIGAQPLGEAHDRMPFFVLQPEIEGYNLTNRSMYDVLEPLQNAMDWLVNTHFFNVRRAVNDMLVVDPSRLTMRDLMEPGPGKMVRAKPAAYGTDMRLAVHQLQIQDVTQNHLKDTGLIADFMQRALGVTDNIMGLMSAGGRRTATEVRQSNTLGINRLKTVAEYFSASGFAPLAQTTLQMTQQHFTQERMFKVVGDTMPKSGDKFLKVRPEDIAGFYDYVPIDGNMPIDRFAQVSLWTQLLGQLRQFPQIAQGYDLAGMFGWIAQLAGLRNVNQFKVQTQVLPPGVDPSQGTMPFSAGAGVDPAALLAAATSSGAGRANGTGPAL